MTDARLEKAEALVTKFTLAAMATGAVPVPAASVAIVGEDAALVALVGDAFGVPVNPAAVVSSLGALGAINLIGKSLFLEGARLFGWGSGGWSLPAVSTLGAATAGLQTWIVGKLAIAIAQNGGAPLPKALAADVVGAAKVDFEAFKAKARARR